MWTKLYFLFFSINFQVVTFLVHFCLGAFQSTQQDYLYLSKPRNGVVLVVVVVVGVMVVDIVVSVVVGIAVSVVVVRVVSVIVVTYCSSSYYSTNSCSSYCYSSSCCCRSSSGLSSVWSFVPTVLCRWVPPFNVNVDFHAIIPTRTNIHFRDYPFGTILAQNVIH